VAHGRHFPANQHQNEEKWWPDGREASALSGGSVCGSAFPSLSAGFQTFFVVRDSNRLGNGRIRNSCCSIGTATTSKGGNFFGVAGPWVRQPLNFSVVFTRLPDLLAGRRQRPGAERRKRLRERLPVAAACVRSGTAPVGTPFAALTTDPSTVSCVLATQELVSGGPAPRGRGWPRPPDAVPLPPLRQPLYAARTPSDIRLNATPGLKRPRECPFRSGYAELSRCRGISRSRLFPPPSDIKQTKCISIVKICIATPGICL